MPDPISPLRRLKDTFGELVDPAVGIIQHVYEQPKEPGGPDFFRFVARAGDTRAFCKQENFAIASAAAETRESALAKTLGEAIERYSAAIFERDELPLTPFSSADFAAVHPSEFALYAAEQYAQPGFLFQPFDASTPVRWTNAVDLTTGKTVAVPACFVFVPYTFARKQEPPIAQPISTGLACHCSFEEAAIGALCEVVERDAFTMTWQARLSRPRIRTSTLSARNRGLIARLGAAGYAVTILDATGDSGVPCILAVMQNANPGALPLVFAASCELDPEAAVRKAIEELAHTERYMWHIMQTVPPVDFVPGHRNVVDQVSHLRFWSDRTRSRHADFIFASPVERSFADVRGLATGGPTVDLATLVARIVATGHRVVVADVTSADVAQLGFHVVRAIVPGYHRLCMGHVLRSLGGRRLWEVPQRLGYEGISRAAGGDNPLPHPFP